jgi:hypothetical protein
MFINVNLPPLTYYSCPQLADCVKQSGGWATVHMNAAGAPVVDTTLPAPTIGPDNWCTGLPGFPPNGGAMFQVFAGQGKSPSYPAGTYSAQITGIGNLTISQTQGSPQTFTVSGTPLTVDVPIMALGSGIQFTVTATDPNNPVRVSLTLPNSDGLFYGPFLDALSPFHFIRFMDWLSTNNSTLMGWSDVTRESARTYAPPPKWTQTVCVPPSVCLALLKQTGKNGWINIPEMVDTGYSQILAGMALAVLPESTRLVLEYSNECWNSMFGQYKYVYGFAGAQTPPLNLPKAYAMLAKSHWDVWRKVWGSEMGRLYRAPMGQLNNPWTVTQALDWLMANADPADPNMGFEVMGGAVYYGSPPATTKTYTAATTTQQILADSVANLPAMITRLNAFLAARTTYSGKVGRRIPVWAYEGGYGTANPVGLASPWWGAYDAAQDDPQRGVITQQWAQQCDSAGLDALSQYHLVGLPAAAGDFGANRDWHTQGPTWQALAAYPQK